MGSSLGTRPSPQWTRHLDSMSLDDLFAAGEAIGSLVEHPGWVLLNRLLDAEVATAEAAMDGRLLDSRAEYAFAHGRRGGLKGAREAAEAILQHAARKLEEQRSKHERGAGSPREE